MPKPGRKVWHLRGIGGEHSVVRRIDLEPGEKFVRRPHLVSSALDNWLTDPAASQRLLELFSAVYGFRPRDLRQKAFIRARLEEAFQSGRLVLVPPVIERSSGGNVDTGAAAQTAVEEPAPAPAPAGAGAAPAPHPVKTWIEFRLLDNNNKPIPNERYHLKVTDGTTRDGNLDSNGSVMISGIDPGNCEITFPDLDARDWAPA